MRNQKPITLTESRLRQIIKEEIIKEELSAAGRRRSLREGIAMLEETKRLLNEGLSDWMANSVSVGDEVEITKYGTEGKKVVDYGKIVEVDKAARTVVMDLKKAGTKTADMVFFRSSRRYPNPKYALTDADLIRSVTLRRYPKPMSF